MDPIFDPSPPLSLENDRARLEPMTLQHLDLLVPIAEGHPDLLRYSPSRFGTRETLQAYFTAALEARQVRIRYPFVIFDKLESAYAGSTSYGNIALVHQRLEIGWTWIGRSFQRTGLNRHCKYLLLSHAFEQLGIERVELKTDSRNRQSRQAMEDIGARFEGELRSHTLLPDGFRRNTVYYSILKEEWPGIKATVFARQA